MSDVDDEFEVIWHEPPLTGRWGARLERFVELLRANPMKWGELPPVKTDEGDVYYPLTVATTLRKRFGHLVESRTVSTDKKSRVRIYARYIADPDEDPEVLARKALRSVRP